MPDVPARWTRPEWERRRAADLARLRPVAEERLNRRGAKHPVRDFLFEYYPVRPSHLLRWSPGCGVLLEGATPVDVGWPRFFDAAGGDLTLRAAALPEHRREFVRSAAGHLKAGAARPPAFGCFGLHEWAMAYRTEEVRHAGVPLRLGAAGTDAVVEAAPLLCTHFDAYRFFTPAAVPRNRVPLSRANASDHDQPGCLHANMDLYKFAFKLMPFVSSDLLADALDLAVRARELDMRASPYDLAAFGLSPVRIETESGRAEYAAGQRAVSAAAVPIRDRLLGVYRALLAACRAD